MDKNGNKYRIKMLEAAVKGDRGHLGGAFSCIEILMAVHAMMRKNDTFVLSKGHSAIALYSILNDLEGFCTDGSYLTEHPSGLVPGIKLTTGSLGHGIGIAAGIALAKQLNNEDGRTYVLVGDGECMEGSVYEAVMFAVLRKLDNLTIILDSNGIMSTQFFPSAIRYAKIFASIGCNLEEVDGHNLNALQDVLQKDNLGASPRFIVAHTVKGKGVSFMENNVLWHNGVPKGEQLETARKELQ